MIPLYGFLTGDTMGLLILGCEDETVAELAARLQAAAALRVAPLARPRVVHCGHLLDPQLTVGAAGLSPLDRFDVVEEGG